MEPKLPGDYIAGFVDGEGCFYLTYRSEQKKNRINQPIYYRWVAYFAIVLRKDDFVIIESIKNTLGCGTISYGQNNQIRYNVQNMQDINKKIIPFFDKYQLRAKKQHDFKLWKEAAEIIREHLYHNSNYTAKEHAELLSIRERMRIYKAKLDREYRNRPNTK